VLWNPALAYAVALLLGLYPLLAGRMAERSRERSLEMARGGVRLAIPAARSDGRMDADGLAERQKAAPEPSAEQPARAPANAVPAGGASAGAGDDRRAPKDAARARPAAPAVPADGPRVPLFGVRAGEETSLSVPPGVTEIELRIAPVPPGTTRVRLSDEPGRRALSAPGDGAIRVPAVWLAQGRYVVELLDGDRTLATARLTVTR